VRDGVCTTYKLLSLPHYGFNHCADNLLKHIKIMMKGVVETIK